MLCNILFFLEMQEMKPTILLPAWVQALYTVQIDLCVLQVRIPWVGTLERFPIHYICWSHCHVSKELASSTFKGTDLKLLWIFWSRSSEWLQKPVQIKWKSTKCWRIFYMFFCSYLGSLFYHSFFLTGSVHNAIALFGLFKLLWFFISLFQI